MYTTNLVHWWWSSPMNICSSAWPYLTGALHHYFPSSPNIPISFVGIKLTPFLFDLCRLSQILHLRWSWSPRMDLVLIRHNGHWQGWVWNRQRKTGKVDYLTVTNLFEGEIHNLVGECLMNSRLLSWRFTCESTFHLGEMGCKELVILENCWNLENCLGLLKGVRL